MWVGVIDAEELAAAAGGTDYLTFDLPSRVRKLRLSARDETTAVSMLVEIKLSGRWYPIFELTATAVEEVVVAKIDTEIEATKGQIRVGFTTSVANDVLKALLTYEKWVDNV